jgi:hypothetical protein
VGAYTLLSFMASWNSFLWPQVVLQEAWKYTLPIGLANMVSQPEYQTEYGILMAGTLLSILPVVVLFFMLQRDFVAGLASGVGQTDGPLRRDEGRVIFLLKTYAHLINLGSGVSRRRHPSPRQG